jgi:glucosyl-3-phosphoglycerate phosphatase
MKRLMIVRHGESEWNSIRRLQGQADIGLSERGIEQAKALAQTVAELGPDKVMSSDLERAHHTAALLGFETSELTPELREINVGDWTGETIADLVAADAKAYEGWRAGTFTPPNGESWADFTARTTTCVATAMEASERLLVVCHGGVVRALLETLVGLSPRMIIPVAPASLTVLARKEPGPSGIRLELFNYSPQGIVLNAPD